MKLFWQSSLMVNSFIFLPGTLILLIYAVGAGILLGHVQLMGWAFLAFLLAILAEAILGILSD